MAPIFCLHHKREKATVFSTAEIIDVLKAAKKAFKRHNFEVEYVDNGAIIKSAAGAIVQRYLNFE